MTDCQRGSEIVCLESIIQWRLEAFGSTDVNIDDNGSRGAGGGICVFIAPTPLKFLL